MISSIDDLIDLHIQGGAPFTVILALLLVINFLLFIYSLILIIIKGSANPFLLEWIKQIGGLAAAWGTFSTITGLFFAFDAIGTAGYIIPFQVISGGMKVALITILYGQFIFSLSIVAYIILKLINQHLSITVK